MSAHRRAQRDHLLARDLTVVIRIGTQEHPRASLVGGVHFGAAHRAVTIRVEAREHAGAVKSMLRAQWCRALCAWPVTACAIGCDACVGGVRVGTD